MLKINDKVLIKKLDVLTKEGHLQLVDDLPDTYINREASYVVFSDFPYFGGKYTIDDIDSEDDTMPYFLSCGIWAPEFLLTPINDHKQEEVKEEKEAKAEVNPENEIIINAFNNRPFGALFMKLIKLDRKIAEFSDTAFSRLKKHELQYIAKLLQDHGAEVVDYNKLTQKELCTYCFTQTLKLNV